MVVGTSASRNPRSAAPSSSSEAWYWGWCSGTAAVTSARIARRPLAGSVIFRPGEHAEHRGEQHHTGAPDAIRGVRDAEPARAADEIGTIGEQRLEQHLQLGRVVLPVAVQGRDVACPALPGQPVTKAQRRSLAPVDRHVSDQNARHCCGALGSAVRGPVHDDDDVHAESADRGGHRAQYVGDAAFLVVRRDHDRQLAQPTLWMGSPERLCRSVIDIGDAVRVRALAAGTAGDRPIDNGHA